MKRLRMDNGDVRDGVVCCACQRPGDVRRYSDGEFYHAGCAPEGVV